MAGGATSSGSPGIPPLPFWHLRFDAARRILNPKQPRNFRESSSMSAQPVNATKGAEAYDVVVVGAGFAGMYMLHRLRGQGFSVRVYEQGDGVGGTWYGNRYPGARSDVESMQYSYSFDDDLQQEWRWPEYFSPQADIEGYANHVTDRFGLRELIRFEARVNRLRW